MLTRRTLELTVVKSPFSVAQTLEKLEKEIQSKGQVIFAKVDHSGGARKANLELKEEKVIIFGDPKVGTFLMQENPLIGLELPLRLLILENQEGETEIVYIDPVSLGESYGIVKNAEILKKMSAALKVITGNISAK